MTLENFLIIAGFLLTVVCGIGYRYCCENVYLRYAKDKKRGRPGAGTSGSGKGKFNQQHYSMLQERMQGLNGRG